MTVSRVMCAGFILAVSIAVGACATGPGQSRFGTEAPVRDVQSLAGRWSGIVQTGADLREDFVDVIIAPDGQYEARSARTIGVLEGRGRVEIVGGRLTITGERTLGTGMVYEKDGKRTMVLQLSAPNGRQFSARLTPRQ